MDIAVFSYDVNKVITITYHVETRKKRQRAYKSYREGNVFPGMLCL